MRKLTDGIDYATRDYEGFRSLMIEWLQAKMPEYTDLTETDAGIVILEALANGLDILSMYIDIAANDVMLPTTQSRRIAVFISRMLGYEPYNQTPSVYPQVFVLTTERSDDTLIPAGTRLRTKDDNDLATLYFETSKDFIIPAGAKGDEKDGNGDYLYTVDVIAGKSVYQDVVGSSAGTPLQSFMLHYVNAIVDSIQVYVNEGDGEELWRRVDTFFDADEHSKVYMALVDDFDQCVIQFGNGLKGKIPVAFPNGIIASYRVGGGEASNIGENLITVMETSVAFVNSTFNLPAKIMGHDKESLESIKVNAPAFYRTRNRLVTLEDYEDLLRMNFISFMEVQCVRDETYKLLAHLYYKMREGHAFTPTLAAQVDAFISERCMIGTSYDISPCVMETVDIEAKLYVSRDYVPEVIENQVETYLAGVTFYYENVPFDAVLVKSDVERDIISTIPGIVSFRINTPTDDIISPSAPQNILKLGTVTIETLTA